MINARAETITKKPSFRNAFKKMRCIIPASGFYERKQGSDGKQPYYFYLTEKDVLGFAGLWEDWVDGESGDVLETRAIITTSANKVLKPVHDRMPAMLWPDDEAKWLEGDTRTALSILGPYPEGEMEAFPVSRRVGSPRNDDPSLIVPEDAA